MNYIEKLKLVDVTKLNTKINNLVQKSIKHFDYDLATKEGIDSIKLLYEIICDKFPEAISKINLEKPIEEKIKRKYTKKSDKPHVEKRIKRAYIKKDKSITSDAIIEEIPTDVILPVQERIKRKYTKKADKPPVEERIKRKYIKKDKTLTSEQPNSSILKTERRGRPKKITNVVVNNLLVEDNKLQSVLSNEN